MAWAFSDSFDPYAAVGDTLLGYWDSGTQTSYSLQTGRFSGSRGIGTTVAGVTVFGLVKASAVNDSVHHFSFAIYQTTIAGSATGNGFTVQLADGATNQCGFSIRGNGDMVFYNGTVPASAGTALGTYTAAVSAANTWTQFEVEIVVHNTAGSVAVRKNGNASNDYSLASQDTSANANNYANKISVGHLSNVTATWTMDDLIWRSDAASVPWIGDVRIVARMPASDVSVQFSRTPNTISQAYPTNPGTTGTINSTVARFTPITPNYSGTVATVSVTTGTGNSGAIKCAIFADNGAGAPGAIIQSAVAPLTPVATGANTFTLSPALALTKGVQYWVGHMSDTSVGTWSVSNSPQVGVSQTTTYAAFPTSNPVVTTTQAPAQVTLNYTAGNYALVAEPQQDGATSYVFDSTPGHADFYGLAPLSITPQAVFGVTTRMFCQKSDAGARSGAVQLKSGGTTVQSTPAALSSSWGWMWRTDTLDPATGSAWTPAGVNNALVGPTVTS